MDTSKKSGSHKIVKESIKIINGKQYKVIEYRNGVTKRKLFKGMIEEKKPVKEKEKIEKIEEKKPEVEVDTSEDTTSATTGFMDRIRGN